MTDARRSPIPPAHDSSVSRPTAEAADRRDQYQLLVRYVRDYAIFSMDAEGVVQSWNEGVRNVLGYEADEFIGSPARVVFTEEDVAVGVPERELAQAAETGTANDDRWLRRRNGDRFWASGITTAIRGQQGDLIGFAKVLRDLTERKLSEEALRLSEERLQLATSAARLGTWDFESDLRRVHPRSAVPRAVRAGPGPGGRRADRRRAAAGANPAVASRRCAGGHRPRPAAR